MVRSQDGTFPVLLARGGRRSVRFLSDGGFLELKLRHRKEGECHPLSDAMMDMFSDPDAIDGVYAAFVYARKIFGPWVDSWIVDLAPDTSVLPIAVRGVRGDSFSLALLFQIVARHENTEWPDGVFVTGAVRHVRGCRCVSIGQAVTKCRWLKLYGYRQLLLPKRNFAQLGRAGLERERCVALPQNLAECIELWKRCLMQSHIPV